MPRSEAPGVVGPRSAGPGPSGAAEHLVRRLAELTREHRVPGAQLAVHDGAATVAVQVGEQRHGSGVPVGADTAFPVGSISKTFTATVAMILVADGDLDLDVPLAEYLPDLSGLGTLVTLGQVLSHTSGLVCDPEGSDSPDASIRRYAVEHCRVENLVQVPGTAFSYSNAGYVLAGRVIEVITGMTWWDAVESILLRPLDIEPAFLAAPHGPGARRAVATGHSVNPAQDRIRPVEQTLTAARSPAGGLAASALDLVALGRLHLAAGDIAALLPDEHAWLLRSAVPAAEPFGIADGWGLGVALFGSGAGRSVGHDGNAEGTACYLRAAPATGCVVAFTSNATTGLAVWRELAADVPSVRITPENTAGTGGGPAGRPGPAVPGCAGSYRNGEVEYQVETTAGGELEMLVDGEPMARLACRENLDGPETDVVLFAQQDVESGEWLPPGRFLRNPATGEIDRIQVDGRIARRVPNRSSGEQRRW